jgi:hypothetical protein
MTQDLGRLRESALDARQAVGLVVDDDEETGSVEGRGSE